MAWDSCKHNRLWFVTTVIAFGILATQAPSESIGNGAKRKPFRNCQFLIASVLPIALFGAITSPTVIHSVGATQEQKAHLGHGIYFDWNRILEKLPEKDRALLKDPKENAIQIVRMLTLHFAQHNPPSIEEDQLWYPRKRYASEYMNDRHGISMQEGYCRHRAIIAVAAINEALKGTGIEAELRGGYDIDRPGILHYWYRVPALGVAGDLTQVSIVDEKNYLSAPVEQIADFEMDYRGVHTVSILRWYIDGAFY